LRELGACLQALTASRADIVIHAAATVGGIGVTGANPATFFYDNAAMGMHVVEASRRAGVEKLVTVGTVCSYPADAPLPFREESLWDGYPEPTNAPYGLAKKLTLVQQQAYRAEHGLRGAYLLLANLYGPRDDFHLESSHVIPALIRKFASAAERGDRSVEVWGSGSATREFLYVDDAAEAVLRACEHYDAAGPVNVGVGDEISIRELAELIARLTGFEGETVWDRSRPDGQARRCLDVSRARAAFGWTASTPLEDGLRATIEWWSGAAKAAA
jgi:GDP-L-fucose synthase